MKKNVLGRIIAGAMTAATVLGTAPAALTAYAAAPPSGYTTDSHEIMAYKQVSGAKYDVKGYVDEAWRGVTCGGGGIKTVVYDTVNNNAISSGITITVTPGITSGGKVLTLAYTLENTSSGSMSLVFGLAADTEVNGGDDSVNIPNASHTILEMTYNGVAFDAFSPDAGFKIYPTAYGSQATVSYNSVRAGADPRTVTEVNGLCDAAFVAYWPDTTLAPGQTVTYTFNTAIATAGSGLLGGASKKGNINTVNIGEFVLDNWESILDYMPNLTKQDLINVNDKHADIFHVDITKADNKFVPDSVVAALADADTTGLHVFIGGGDAITFMKKNDYSAYKTMCFNHTDKETANSRTIAFEQCGAIGGKVVLHTAIGVSNQVVTVYEVVDGQEVEFTTAVSNAEGLVCFDITETATYVLRY